MHFVSESHKSSKPFGSHYYRALVFLNAVEHCIHCFQSNYFKVFSNMNERARPVSCRSEKALQLKANINICFQRGLLKQILTCDWLIRYFH